MNRFHNFRILSKIKFFILLAVCIGLGTSYVMVTKAEAQSNKKSRKSAPILDPNNPNSILYLDTSGKLAGKGDPDRPASESVRIGRGWHPTAISDQRLPKDRYGLIDWAKLVRDKMVAPKGAINPGAEEEMPPLDMNIEIIAKSDFVNDVIFPHWIHTYWLKCPICHDTVGGAIFIPSAGENNMYMQGIGQGKWCGRCHGKVAFPLTDCTRCHVKPKKNYPK